MTLEWGHDIVQDPLRAHLHSPAPSIQGLGFEATFFRWAELDFSPQVRRFLTEAMIIS